MNGGKHYTELSDERIKEIQANYIKNQKQNYAEINIIKCRYCKEEIIEQFCDDHNKVCEKYKCVKCQLKFTSVEELHDHE